MNTAPVPPAARAPSRGPVLALQVLAGLLAAAALVLAVLAAMDPPEADAEAAFAAALAGLGLLRIAAAVQRRALASRGWLDTASGLANGEALLPMGEAMLARARRARQPLTMLVLDFQDLVEVREIYGRGIGQRVLQRVVSRMQAIAGPYGLTLRTGRCQFTLLVPRVQRDRALASLQRVLGRPPRVEYDAGDSEIVLVPDIAAETAAPDVETVRELYRELAGGLARNRRYEERRQQWLQRERERHSRPMTMHA